MCFSVWCGGGGTLGGGLRLGVRARPRDGATFPRGGAARCGGDAQAVGEVEVVLRGGRGGRQRHGGAASGVPAPGGGYIIFGQIIPICELTHVHIWPNNTVLPDRAGVLSPRRHDVCRT